MIGRLQGTIVEKQPPTLLVDVHGVGYELEAPMSVFYELPPVGEDVVLRTHLAVREDAHVLYAFRTESERRLFRNLIRVSGVGPKLALALLSGMPAEDFVRCVEGRDINALTRLPGVGKKTAERLVMEMADRLGELGAATSAPAPVNGGDTAPPADASGEAVSALIALGYKPAEASRLIKGIDTDGRDSEALIREALRRAVRSG
ncbi:Holliday junction branch migration protein RuvA [Arhodomonas sp. AD133]|uniref:Holliday junction branch migration protein RuvA n=1 Tax=Arhodomonas sp. AD133 TaxID=3415009 RepID=UPI003EBF6F4E